MCWARWRAPPPSSWCARNPPAARPSPPISPGSPVSREAGSDEAVSDERSVSMTQRVVLAYSGGLDTSVAVKWIQEEWGAEVIALAVDVGQQADDPWDVIKARALAAGAVEARVVDARAELADNYLVND